MDRKGKPCRSCSRKGHESNFVVRQTIVGTYSSIIVLEKCPLCRLSTVLEIAILRRAHGEYLLKEGSLLRYVKHKLVRSPTYCNLKEDMLSTNSGSMVGWSILSPFMIRRLFCRFQNTRSQVCYLNLDANEICPSELVSIHLECRRLQMPIAPLHESGAHACIGGGWMQMIHEDKSCRKLRWRKSFKTQAYAPSKETMRCCIRLHLKLWHLVFGLRLNASILCAATRFSRLAPP